MQDSPIGVGIAPALGLLAAAACPADYDVAEALRASTRRQLAEPQRLYGREYEMNSLYGQGACLLRVGRVEEATDCFQRALLLYPDHVQSHLGLSVALRTMGSQDAADMTRRKIRAILETLATLQSKTIVHSRSRVEASFRMHGPACKALDDAPRLCGSTLPSSLS